MTAWRAVVWDCDGTVVDSEPIGIGVWTELLRGFGCHPSDADWDFLVGRPFAAFYEYFSQRCDVPPPDDLMEAYVGRLFPALRDGLRAFPDAVAAVDRVRAAGVPTALASSSFRNRLDLMLEITSLAGRFDATVAGDEVERGKPSPEIYLTAAAAIRVPSEECLAVEDSVPGVDSAKAAGMGVVGVARGARDIADLENADVVVTRLDAELLMSLLDESAFGRPVDQAERTQ